MINSKNIKQVVFDLDHTLWDFSKNSKMALMQIYNDLNLGLYIDNFEIFYQKYVEINDAYWKNYREGKVKKEDLRVGRFYDTLSDFEVENSQLATEIAEKYVAISPYQTNLIDGSIELLDALAGRYPLHILTNGFQEIQDIKLTNSGLKKYFESITCSDEIGINKPDPRIFRHKENKIDVKPNELILIGDNLEADVQGAINAGWQAIYFSKDSVDQVVSVTQLSQILQIL